MRVPSSPRRVLPLLVAVNSLGIVMLAALLVFAFQTRGEQLEQIQAERRQNIERTCLDVNARHDRTIEQLERGIAAVVRSHPERAVRLRESRRFTVLLIEALVPKRDCAALAERQVSRTP